MSAGGLQPLRQLLTRLPERFPAAVVVVQHVGIESQLPAILRSSVCLPAKFAEAGEPLRGGMVYVSRPKRHIVVNPDRTIGFSDAARVHLHRPSADWFFRSMAAVFQEHGIAVILSGCLDDGARGIGFVQRAGGAVIAQHPLTCAWSSMPLAAIATGAVDDVLAPDQIGDRLIGRVRAADRRAARRWERPFCGVRQPSQWRGAFTRCTYKNDTQDFRERLRSRA